MSSAGYLARMANDIAAFFETQPVREEAVLGMVVHLEKFWEPRMRRRIVHQLHQDASELVPLAREAVSELSRRIDPDSGELRPS